MVPSVYLLFWLTGEYKLTIGVKVSVCVHFSLCVPCDNLGICPGCSEPSSIDTDLQMIIGDGWIDG